MIESNDYAGIVYHFDPGLLTAAVLLLILLLVLATAFLSGKKAWRGLCLGTLIVAIALIICLTLVLREKYYRGILPIPFKRLADSPQPAAVLSEMLENLLMFLPVGFLLSALIADKKRRPIAVTVAFSLGFSLAIEILQYVFSTGYAQADDLLMNAMGAFLGALSYSCGRRIREKRSA